MTRNLRLIACGLCANLSQFFDVLAEHLAVKQPIAFDTNQNIDRARRLHGGSVDVTQGVPKRFSDHELAKAYAAMDEEIAAVHADVAEASFRTLDNKD